MRARKPWRSSGQSGFTLVELLIVVALIGILASLAVPQFHRYRHRAAVAAAQATAHCLETGFAAFDPFSADPVDRLPMGVSDQAGLIAAADQVGCKVSSSAATSLGGRFALELIQCQRIVICPDGRVIPATCLSDELACGNNSRAARVDYELTLGVPNYADTIVISSNRAMQTNIVTTGVVTPIPAP